MPDMMNPQGGMPQAPPDLQGGGNPALAQLSQRPSTPTSGAPLLQMILTFLAGAGLEGVMKSLKGGGKGSAGGDPNRPHKPGMQIAPSNAPGVNAAPSLVNPQANAPGGQPGQGPQAGGMNPQMLQKLLMMLLQKQGGGMPPQGAPGM